MTVYADLGDVVIHHADAGTAWQDMPAQSADAIVTSPPYWGLRDYGRPDQLGHEATVGGYVTAVADVLDRWGRQVMVDDGSLWVNLGDTYATRGRGGHPGSAPQLAGNSRRRSAGGADRRQVGEWTADRPREKSLHLIPARVGLAMIDRGWMIRNQVVWKKTNAMPTSATDRLACTHETVLHLVREPRYRYDLDAIRRPHARRWTPGRNGGRGGAKVNPRLNGDNMSQGGPHPQGANPGDVWEIATQPNPHAHFAAFPAELVRQPIVATVPEGGTVVDMFAGSGTTAVMARRLGRRAVIVDVNGDYCALAATRLREGVLDYTSSA